MKPEESKPDSEIDAEPSAIALEPSPFEPGYQPGSLPQISVPDLPEDAVSLSAESLAQIPTLTDQVSHPSVQEEEPQALAAESEVLEEVEAQATQVQADTWIGQMQVRMTKLSDDIHTLNDRLDRLEQRSKTKA